MSIRLRLIGIDLEKLKSIFGCKDLKVAEELKKRCQKFFDEFFDGILLESEKKDLLKVQSLIDAIVMGKITPQEAEENDFFPLLLKNVLIFYDQDVIWADVDGSWGTFYDYLSDKIKWKLKENKESEEIKLLNNILTGRALSTDYNKLPWMEVPYGYLKNKEIKKLLDYMKEHKEIFYDCDGWGKIFPESLKEVYEKGIDLFYDAS